MDKFLLVQWTSLDYKYYVLLLSIFLRTPGELFLRHIFWLEAGKVAGRTGPNKNLWVTAEFARAGFSAIISVNNADLCHVDDIENSGLVLVDTPATRVVITPGSPDQFVAHGN